jgi:integration host factor subunit beta
MGMNKSDLVEELSKRAVISVKQAAEVVDFIFDSMTNELGTGKRIEIRGFGSFVIKRYRSYLGRNPKTKERIEVPPKCLPYFKVGKELRARVDGRPAPPEPAE